MRNIKSAPGLSKTQKSLKRSSRKPHGAWAKVVHYADTVAFAWPVRKGLYEHLAAQISNTIPVETALDSYRKRLQRAKRVSSDKIVADISRRMRDGSTLAAAMSKWIPEDEVGIINSGELSGDIPKALELLVESKDRIAAVVASVKAAMTRPLVYVLAVYAFILALTIFVLPNLQSSLPAEKARGSVVVMYQIAALANSWVAIIPPAVGFIAVNLMVYALPRWRGRYRVRAEQFFPFSFYRDIQGYAWLMGFTALLRAGMADVQILKQQSDLANPWLKERLRALWLRMEDGRSLPEALLAKGKGGMPAFAFPNPNVIDDISSLAGFADFSDRITKVASRWAYELEQSMNAKAKKFGIYAEAAMYGVITLLLLVVSEMSDQMSQVAG